MNFFNRKTVSASSFGKLAAAGLLLLLARTHTGAQAPAASLAQVEQLFAAPPDDARIMMRWWWFGPAVVKPELEREILAMKAGGIGGFEIQPVYPVALDDPSKGFRNLPYMSPEFLDAVGFASTTARANGMRIDMTLASGWPYGGAHVPITQAAGRLRLIATDVPSSATSVGTPDLGTGESLIAVFTGEGTKAHYDPAGLSRVATPQPPARLALPAASANRVALFFLASRTGQQVKRPAVGADGFVLDHFDKAAIETHLKEVGEPLMKAFGDHPPFAVFSDSLEVYGADWTPDLPAEFQKRRGYDLIPHLPELFEGTGPQALAVRHDWGVTLTELIDERYLQPLDAWATAHHTQFRSQTYGDPAVSLSSNRLVALPEGEGPQWRRFSYTRLATSASHLFGRPVTSAETWTWLHSPAFRATPLDMKAEADLFFLEGVNQLIGHGWPYTPPAVAEPGWAFYAAAVFNDHNPWWTVMPEVTRYLQRMSFLLRQGQPANDIAVLLPNDDAYTDFKPGKVSLSDVMPNYITPKLTEQILNAGYGFDYIDAEAIGRQGIGHPVLVMPRVHRLAPAVLAKIADYAAHGGKVIAIGSIPSEAPGLANAVEISGQVAGLSGKLFATGGKGVVIQSEEDLGQALHRALPADMELSNAAPELGFLHRKLADADVYFLANTSNHEVHTAAKFRSAHRHAASLDPMSMLTTAAARGLPPGPVQLDLAPYESRVIVLGDAVVPVPGGKPAPASVVEDLSTDWTLAFPQEPGKRMAALTSWTTEPATRFFSGVATYTRDVDLTAAQLQAGPLLLDFGPGTPVEVDPRVRNGTRALLESPVREAAVVLVNGRRLGSIWHPPYRLDITDGLHPGKNRIELQVANTAINGLAGRTLPDYRLLNSKYGVRFVPQDMENLQPLPSGILGSVKLVSGDR